MNCTCHTGRCELHHRVLAKTTLYRYKTNPTIRKILTEKMKLVIDPALIEIDPLDLEKEKQLAESGKVPILGYSSKPKGLGDRVEQALSMIGITKERVEDWVGEECGCAERQEKLNQLGSWAHEVVMDGVQNAQSYLEKFEKLIGMK